MDIISNTGGAGSFPFDDSSPPSFPSTGRGRARSVDFGLPGREGLLDLARTYIEFQARLWPELSGKAAVPAADAATIAAMADDFERQFRTQSADIFQPCAVPRIWMDLGLAYLRFSDENSNPRSLDQQLLNVLNRARRDGVVVPWQYVLADAAVSGTLACRRGYTLAKTLVERRNESGVARFLIDDLSRMSRNTIESLRLGELAGEKGVRVVGASDGFDSANPQPSLLLPRPPSRVVRPHGKGSPKEGLSRGTLPEGAHPADLRVLRQPDHPRSLRGQVSELLLL